MNRFKAIGMLAMAGAALAGGWASADVYNLKVVTDASPDYSDLDSLVHSATSQWKTDEEKMWAMFHWSHIARRQTNPMMLHGKAETDPIRQFNDYGYTMCSTISGISSMIWQHMGYKTKYYDIAVHTVPEVFYGGRWHHYDNSLSVYYTLCDGKTVAGIEDIGKTLACEASGGKEEPGHIAIYHAVNGTGPDGFLEGADTIRDLRHLGRDTFSPKALKYRTYYNDGERGHRYILNLRDGETYSRHYHRLDGEERDPAYFTPNGKSDDGKPRDPDAKNVRYRIRGNGVRTYTPAPAPDGVYKVEGANVITSLKISAESASSLAISTTNGLTWKDVQTSGAGGALDVKLVDEVNGAYEVLVKAPDAKNLKFETITQVNSKTLPKLNIGANTVYVGAGEQTGSIVVWPELQSDRYKPYAIESVDIKTKEDHEGWNAVMNPSEKGKAGYVVFKVDAPDDITRITQGGRMYVRNPKSSVAFEHSFDGGKTWAKSYQHTETEQPWDDIQNQVTDKVPAGTKSVLFKYTLNGAGLYSVRMEVNHKVKGVTAPSPVEVTYEWSEVQEDYSKVKRSHTQLVDTFPATYTINVGGADHPVMESVTVSPKGTRKDVKYGYSDGKDAGGQKWVGRWVTYGKNLAAGKKYTLSIPPSKNSWEAGDPDLTKLTDGRVGSSFSGGQSYREGPLWTEGLKPEIVVDLGKVEKAAAFRVHLHGFKAQDAIKGQVKDEVEVLVSADGQTFTPAGQFDFRLRWKDIPVNYMWPDDEQFTAYNHVLVLDKPVEVRFVKYACKASRFMVISEVQVLDGVKYDPFDLRIALPRKTAGLAQTASR